MTRPNPNEPARAKLAEGEATGPTTIDLPNQSSWPWATLSLAMVTIGLGLRIWTLLSPMGRLDADEAVVALMGRAIATGHRPPVFFYGQYYGGTIEPFLVGLALKIHNGPLSVKMVPLLLSGVACWPFQRALKRIVGARRSWLGAALLFSWPGTTWLSTKERGFYWVGMVLVCCAVWLAVQIQQTTTPSIRLWALFGLNAGVAWYDSAQCMYLIAPLSIWLVATQRPNARKIAAASAGAIIGAIPWLYGFWQFRNRVFQQETSGVSYATRLWGVVRELLPRTLGLRRLFVPGWTFGIFGLALFIMLIAMFIFYANEFRNRARPHTASWIPICLVIFPLFAAVPTLSVFLSEPRYGLYFIPTVVAFIVTRVKQFKTMVGVAIVALAIACASAAQLNSIARHRQQPLLDLVPSDTRTLEQVLHHRNISTIYADYWVAYPITFRGSAGLIASPLDLPRIPAYQQIVDGARTTTWVLYRDSQRDRAIAKALRNHHIEFSRTTVDAFAIYALTTYVNPSDFNAFWRRNPPGA